MSDKENKESDDNYAKFLASLPSGVEIEELSYHPGEQSLIEELERKTESDEELLEWLNKRLPQGTPPWTLEDLV